MSTNKQHMTCTCSCFSWSIIELILPGLRLCLRAECDFPNANMPFLSFLDFAFLLFTEAEPMGAVMRRRSEGSIADTWRDFFSTRMDCQAQQAAYGWVYIQV